SGLLVNLAGILIWAARGPDTIGGFLAVNALGLAIASFVWSAIELSLRRARGARRVSEELDQFLAHASGSAAFAGPVWPFAHTARIAALALLGVVVCAHSGLGWQGTISRAETVLTWQALAATLA